MSEARASNTVTDSLRLRSKYRLPGDEGCQFIPLRLLGVHPDNRAGQYPSPYRVVNLLCQILRTGFNANEANHEGVVVQELPVEYHDEYKRKHGSAYQPLRRYNLDRTKGVSELKPAFSEEAPVTYGTLSHSTLTVGLLCLLNEAEWPTADEKEAADLTRFRKPGSVAWDLKALKAGDINLRQVLEHGIRFEVLSWRVLLEEAEGTCSKISHALNLAQAVAMNTHELECLSKMLKTVQSELAASKVANRVDWMKVKAVVDAQMPGAMEESEQLEMFTFVINTGAATTGHAQALLDFGRRFVDHSKRRLAPQAFAAVNALAEELPRSKVALLMRSYHKTPNKGICPPPEPTWAKLKVDHMVRLEELLAHFSSTLGPAVAGLGEGPAALLLANVVMEATEAMFTHSKPADDRADRAKQEMLRRTAKYYEQVKAHAESKTPPSTLPTPKHAWMDWSKVAAAAAAAAAAEKVQPVVLQFDADGRPTTQQMASSDAAADDLLVLPVQAWQRSSMARGLNVQHWHESVLACALAQHHSHEKSVDLPVQVLCDPRGQKFWAVATRDLDAGALQLPLCAPLAKRLSTQAASDRAVKVSVQRKRPDDQADPEPTEYWLAPDWKPPVPRLLADDSQEGSPGESQRSLEATAVGAGGAPAAAEAQQYKWVFDGGESIHFFWAVERMTADELMRKRAEKGCEAWAFNMALEDRVHKVLALGGVNLGSEPQVAFVSLPVMTNSARVRKGDRLLLQIVKQEKAPRKVVAWKEAVKAQAKQQEKEHESATKKRKVSQAGGSKVVII